MEIQEIIRRWQAGVGPREIASGIGLSRNTVRKYLAAAKAEGIARDGPAADAEQLSRLAGISQSGPRRVATPRAGSAGALGGSDLPVAHRRPVADDPHPGVAGRPRVRSIVSVAAPFHFETQLASAQQDHGADGGHPAG